ncbi:hypothetical protein ACRB68_59580 [Actinomadura sp. RB68]|uniref:Metal-dependent hydrolase n=2 Tax=Actinomadura macrotermitis TaxID=2585200 RepID=A0A7K0C3A0_9ACTN|nr:hypothetical protein [Actinomadura macrotermitis]
MSHVVAALSAVFPEGEAYFIRTVRNYRDQVTDPGLKEQVTGFVAQEAAHRREHRQFNDRLAALGYPTPLVDRLTRYVFGLTEKSVPRNVQLAVTAALEHYTATLAEVLLTDPDAQKLFGDDEIRTMFLWHALEEVEHKAVAFDVYQVIGGGPLLRAWTMRLVSLSFVGSISFSAALSMALDPAAYDPRRLLPSVVRLRRSPWLRRDTLRRIQDYQRADFHPGDRETAALVARWSDELSPRIGKPVSMARHGEPQPGSPADGRRPDR